MSSYGSFYFLADEDIFLHHHGVRRYLFGLVYSLSRLGCAVSIWVAHHGSSKVIWKRLVMDPEQLRNNGFSGNLLFASGRDEIADKIRRDGMACFNSSGDIKWSYEGATEDLGLLDGCDVCVLAAPWVSSYLVSKPKCQKFYSLAMDAIPNRYYFSEPENSGLRDFAHQHMLGYKFADEDGDGILCISPATARQCEIMGFGRKRGLRVLPSLLPPGYDSISVDQIPAVRDNIIILAAPFDRRKGLKNMPELLNAVSIDKLIIYGRPRCSVEDLIVFFEELTVQKVEWWLDVDVEQQINLYKSSKVLLFPSIAEGLGLPVIEAYACGTSVLVSNIAPLNDIALNDDILPAERGQCLEKLKSRMAEKTQPNNYHLHAMGRWSVDHIKDFEW